MYISDAETSGFIGGDDRIKDFFDAGHASANIAMCCEEIDLGTLGV